MHRGQSKISTSLQILCSPCSLQAGGLHSTEMPLVFGVIFAENCMKMKRKNELRWGARDVRLLDPPIPSRKSWTATAFSCLILPKEVFITLLSPYICHCFHSLCEQAVIRHRFTQGQIKAEEATRADSGALVWLLYLS